MYLANALIVGYLPNFSSQVALTYMVRQNFPLPKFSCVQYAVGMPHNKLQHVLHETEDIIQQLLTSYMVQFIEPFFKLSVSRDSVATQDCF